MLRLYKGLCVLFAFLVVYSTNINAQIKTKIFNDNPVKENSIVVKYDNIFIKAKGNSITASSCSRYSYEIQCHY